MALSKKRPPKPDRSEEFASHESPTAAALWRHDGKARLTVPVYGSGSITPELLDELRQSNDARRAQLDALPRPRPKAAPVRSEAYRRLVAAMPCIYCKLEGRSQAAHGPTLGKSIKCDDRLTFPLCADQPGRQGCHSQMDQYLMTGDKATKRDIAQRWAKLTRAQIRAMGWPKGLPLWEDDA